MVAHLGGSKITGTFLGVPIQRILKFWETILSFYVRANVTKGGSHFEPKRAVSKVVQHWVLGLLIAIRLTTTCVANEVFTKTI